MNDYFHRLFHFNNWANQIIGTCLTDNKIQDTNCLKLMSHPLHAQSNWYKRIIGLQDDRPVWEVLELPTLVAQLEENDILWQEYVWTLEPHHFSELIAYYNMAGQPQLNSVTDMLAHVVNHATYHRGQIVRRIRELGYAPPSTDYIQYARIFPF